MDSLWVTHSKIYFDEFCLLHVGPAAIILQDEEGRDIDILVGHSEKLSLNIKIKVYLYRFLIFNTISSLCHSISNIQVCKMF